MLRLALCAVVAAALTGCGKSQFTAPSASAGETLRVALDATPATLDPALAQDLATGDLMRQVFEGLVRLGEDNLVQPCLAESWTVSPDGKVYTFRLKAGVHFQDGSELKPEDVVWSFQRAVDPRLLSPVGKNYLGGVAKVEVVPPSSVRLTLAEPTPSILGKLTYPVCAVVKKGAVPNGVAITKPEQMVGTGPYRVARYIPEQGAELERFEGYHGEKPTIRHLEMPVIKDPATRMNKFRAGDLDVVGVPPEDVASMPESQLKHYPRPAVIYLGLNPSAYPPFASIAVRRAFAQALDKERLVADALGSSGMVANGILPPGVPGYREGLNPLPFDIGVHLDSANLPPLELVLGGQSNDRRKVADAVATRLRQALGVEVSVRQMEMGAYLQKANRKELAFFLGSWYADYLDPENFLSVTLAEYGQNRVAYKNPAFTQLCAAADHELDPKKRITLYQAAEDLALTDVAWIPLYYPVDVLAVGPRVERIPRNLMGFLPFASARLKK
ncbi:MAG: ABC transporter substrate-binding protein [Fimbriimonadales bacterium]